MALKQGGREDMKERKVLAYDCVDQAIKKVLQQRPPLTYLRPGLGTQDIFFSQVAAVDQILLPLVNYEEEMLMSNISPADKLKLALSVASVLESILREAVQHRRSKAESYSSRNVTEFDLPEYCPWTATDDVRSIVSNQLQMLHDAWVEARQELTVTDQDSQDMWKLYADLADVLFQGFQDQLHSVKPDRKKEVKDIFEERLKVFMSHLLSENQFSVASKLAETYEHFPTLVNICEMLDNTARLQEYFKRFADKGFADYLFKHYLDQGKLKKLLSFGDLFPRELGQFLRPHPYLSWLHHLGTQEYNEAADCLCDQAIAEEHLLARKKTLLSLGKLSILASENPDIDKLSAIDSELTMLEYQKNIPVDCIEQMGYVPGKEPPLSPRTIVELYVGDANMESEVIHFLCALEFLSVAFPESDDPEALDLKLYIWSQAVLKDDWSQLSDVDDPMEQLKQTFLFTIVDTAYHKGLDVLKMLPDLSDLLHCSCLKGVEFANSASFHYLMHAGYEQVKKKIHSSHTTQAEKSP